MRQPLHATAQATENERKAIISQAAAWLAKLHQGTLSASDQAALQHWQAQSPQHAHIWSQAASLAGKFEHIPAPLGRQVLDRPALFDRRAFIKPLLGLAVVLPAGGLAYRLLPWQAWVADYSTAVGGRERYVLADGTSLLLNSRSAVDVAYSPSSRTLHLRQGDIYIETAHDAQQRPLIVQTPHGRLRALGTKFVASLADNSSYLAVLEGAVEITPADITQSDITHIPTVVQHNQQSFFTASGISSLGVLDNNEIAWVDGVLYAENMPLEDFIKLLSRYRSGILRCDAAARDIRISGAFQLKDPEQILATLQRTRPLRIEWKTRYWGTFYKI